MRGMKLFFALIGLGLAYYAAGAAFVLISGVVARRLDLGLIVFMGAGVSLLAAASIFFLCLAYKRRRLP